MNKTLKKLVNQKRLSEPDIMACFNIIAQNGDIVLLKIDGERDENIYTVVITSSRMSFDAIRYDAATLEEAVKKSLREYLEIRGH